MSKITPSGNSRAWFTFRVFCTHRGEWMGIALTGREVTFEGLTIDRVIEGKIVELWFG